MVGVVSRPLVEESACAEQAGAGFDVSGGAAKVIAIGSIAP